MSKCNNNPSNNEPFCYYCGGDSGTNGHLEDCTRPVENNKSLEPQLIEPQRVMDIQSEQRLDNLLNVGVI